ncbi:unnamed protein product [Urochloa decumbens]|uniref:Uncharacterized protein n=1 Tax=Urochloa decumbens TaxID=240449 RepID=A0ABC8YIF2_9POAL
MAVVLDAFAAKLAGILVGIAKEEVEMLLGVPGEITKLETTLGDLSSILGDAERRRLRDSAVERWVRELKDVMYDADDILDLCRIMEGGEDPMSSSTAAPKTNSRCWNLFFCFRNPVVAHEIGKKIKALNQRLVEIAERSSRFGFITQAINSSAYPINNDTNNPWCDGNIKTGSSIIKSDVVGEKIEEDTKKIVDLLIRKVGLSSNSVVVNVAITGMGGIGKTTLARMVFADSTVEDNFEERIWLSVNQDFNEIGVLQSVLASFGAKHEGFAGNKDLLERALKDTVRQRKKFLLVMDDVWSEKVWNDLLRVPLSHAASGCCVLMTTRNDGVAHGMKAQYLHRVDKLQKEDAWILLKNQREASSVCKHQRVREGAGHFDQFQQVPPGFRELKDLVTMLGFPTHSDGSADGWCSLEELGSLSKLRGLDIAGLEKAPSGSTAGRAMLSSKHHLTDLELAFTSRLRDDGEVEDNISEEEHKRIEDVLSNLCPPTSVEELDIIGYFARGLPQWIRNMSAFESLRRLALEDYACCMQLPSGLGQLPFLDYFWVTRAPSVQFIGHDFLDPSMGGEADGKGEAPVLTGSRNNRRLHYRTWCGAGVAFPKLRELGFEGMLRWTKWEWEQQVKAMPVLENLFIEHCKLHHLPAGLAQHAYRLRELDLRNMEHLASVENFPSLVKLCSYNNPRLERISNNPSLQCIDISNCTALEELDGLTSLQSLVWEDLDAEALPQYLREAKLKKLRVDCSRSLLKLIALQDESAEWGKIKHVQQLKAYAGHKIQEHEEESDQSSQEDEEAEWYIYYTKEPYSFDAYLGESRDEVEDEDEDKQAEEEEVRD